ncbi:uncharacterized protein LOC119370264 [Jatropha curcas]|uniref:uncharacterized protein LOC119370264 n=1 Tax=Jatropha curcas TaxID=180498 RepID=UPI001895C080|nr:uncharacterized protein LOC119370264 [Jatropha curcas]
MRRDYPPPSSSGTSGASSSAQPPMLPSLPSVPSSSTPLPGPVESSPASQSPTTNFDAFVHLYFTYVFFLSIYPSSRASRQIMRIIKLHLDQDGYTWDVVPQEARDFYWEEFQNRRKKGKRAAERSQRYGELSKRLGEESVHSRRKRKHEIFAQNRRSETGGDGAGPSRHIGGSISATETSQLLAEKYSREPTPMEVFTYTHTKDHDCHTFVDRRALGGRQTVALGVNGGTSSTTAERFVASQAE